jgi:23S rRNA (adenine2503-C2)-methyltransferase
MKNIPKTTRELLETNFFIDKAIPELKQESSDGTIKTVFRLIDKTYVEGVLIPTDNRTTACISSQVGCNAKCSFCATGKMAFKRNLTAGEIYDQVFEINKQSEEIYNAKLSNIVFMGMGEPLLNYENTLGSLDRIISEKGLGFSPRRITLSTVGIPKMIKKLADDDIKFNLAVSLHTANNEKRNKIIPINRKYPIDTLMESLVYFHEKTKKRITFEYLLLENFNNNIDDAQELAELCKAIPVKINLIEYNEIDNSNFKKSAEEKTIAFANYLESKNMLVQIRKSRGQDIDAACGQLALKHK